MSLVISGGVLDVFWPRLLEGRGVGPVIVLVFLVPDVEEMLFFAVLSDLRLYCARVCRGCSAERPPPRTRDTCRQ